MRRAVLVSLALAGLVGPNLIAQGGGPQGVSGAPPSQGQPATPPKSTALILGQVVDGSTGQPISDAVVTLAGNGGARGVDPTAALAAGASPQAQQAMQLAAALSAQAAGRGGPGGPQQVLTGADGRFVFHDLPPGRYQVAASLTGYVASLITAPASSPNSALNALAAAAAAAGPQSSPTALLLKEGEFAANLKLRLWKQAVVSGAVLDDAGQPAVGMEVQVVRRVMLAGRARYAPAGSTHTDDRGAYRISGLTPGSFLVVVPQAPVAIPAAVFNNLIDALTGGGQSGAGWAMLDLVTSGIELGRIAGGARVGDYMVTTSGAAPIVGPDGHLQMFQTTFYPGATAPAQASVISLASGEERSDLNVQLRLIPAARITGVATGPDGPVGNLGIRLIVPGDGVVSDSEIDVASTLSRADGSFAFFGVPPGQFLLRAVKQPRLALPVEAMSDPTIAAMFGGDASGTSETLFASESVTVSNDIDGLVLQLAPGFHVSGRVEFAGVAGRPLPTPAQMQTMTITLMPVAGGAPATLLGGLMNPDRANAQGEFKTKGYAPGRYAFNMAAPPGWQVKSAVVGGRDVLDAPLEITNADIVGIVVTFTDKLGQLSGRVSAPGETDLSEVSVIAFPYNYRGWIAGGMSARLSRSTRASREGAYVMPNLPAGEYLVAAIDRASEGDMQDPAFVDALARIGRRVTIGSDPVTFDATVARVVIR